MFDTLNRTSLELAVGAVYYAIQLLSHSKETRLEAFTATSIEQDKILALSWIGEILKQEGTTLDLLHPEKAQDYITALSSRLRRLAQRRLVYDKAAGQRLLNELRQTHMVSTMNVTRTFQTNEFITNVIDKMEASDARVNVFPIAYFSRKFPCTG